MPVGHLEEYTISCVKILINEILVMRPVMVMRPHWTCHEGSSCVQADSSPSVHFESWSLSILKFVIVYSDFILQSFESIVTLCPDRIHRLVMKVPCDF